jgi:transcriptional regulator with PAS, ATPase and Fis domain
MAKKYGWLGESMKVVDVALRAKGWSVCFPAEGTLVCGQRLPTARQDRPFLWVVNTPVPVEQLQSALNLGAYEVVALSDDAWVKTLLARLGELQQPQTSIAEPQGFVARSQAAQRLLQHLQRAAQTSMPVLLTGETGTGKELCAQIIHRWSSRGAAQLVPINCAAIPNELMEGELFGYVKGAFSGAATGYDGLVSAAEGGTVFLDEVDDMPKALQVKMLRVLEDRVISRLGENKWRAVNFRIVAATNRNLERLIQSEEFGADLYQRLATVRIELPPLRERLADLEPLAMKLIEAYYRDDPAAIQRHQVRHISPDAFRLLEHYRWPGNIRELRNVIVESLVSKRTGTALLASDLPRRLFEPARVSSASLVSRQKLSQQMAQGTFSLRRELASLERMALEEALQFAQGNASAAAKYLGEVGRAGAKNPGDTVRAMKKRLRL